MRDECIGIPPRFECEFCPSKFRRKYHLVRHLNARHNGHGTFTDIKVESPVASTSITPTTTISAINAATVTNENEPDRVALDLTAANAGNNFSVEAIMMKKENCEAFGPNDLKFFEDIQQKFGFKVNPEIFRNMKMNAVNY